ncbi:hypothetical protein THAOC_02177 [Thalassiosira oceanica]|uniref:PUB domain-containing protein n=1 Tax=Thalassiosira oceanica TaxID=159749 RepID=K0TGA7_THAOC|nr:hypothetical protein THAOC_02177 [Thalassiosira oceanica]|eukprot:EJK76079.1 hypothetical protein THAOC_02177 [Thalassiosira oceanica]
MQSKWTTSALSTLATLQLAALIWFGCHYVSRYYTIWFITFVQAFWTCLFFIGDRMFAYVPLLRGPPDLYYDLKENPWLTSLVVYFVLPWVTAVIPGGRFDDRHCCDERDESWWRWWTLQNVATVALTAAVIATLVSVLVERRDQVRRLFFPALRRGRADFRISERGKIGCDALSSDDDIGNGCGQTNSDDDSADDSVETSTNFPSDNEDSRSEAESAIKSACLAIIREDAAEPGRGVNSARRLLQYLENIRRHPDEERYRRLKVSNRIFRGAIYDTAAMGVLGALGFEERDGYMEYVFDGIAECDLDVSFAMQAVNEAQEEMTRRAATAEGRQEKPGFQPTDERGQTANIQCGGQEGDLNYEQIYVRLDIGGKALALEVVGSVMSKTCLRQNNILHSGTSQLV